ncbi:MAG: NUDIX hydrolase [Candidatus Marsarchaeota archaeon]|jgi:8-oxo-dGTP pyrophosphatase MutT (NUDIX family)|nr:NUDIX hydrolase [Candidatus Marsarchaeota archaeon]
MEKNDYVDVAFVIPVLREGVLYLKRNDNDDIEPGKWCVPSGHVEKGENYDAAAIRELEEETGLKAHASMLEYIGTFNHSLDGTDYRVWLYMIENRSLRIGDVKIFPEEHSDKKCVSIEALGLDAYARLEDNAKFTAIDNRIIKNYLDEVKTRLETKRRVETHKNASPTKA